MPHDRYSLEYREGVPVSPAWKRFIDELRSDRYRANVRRLYGVKGVEFRFHWHYTPRRPRGLAARRPGAGVRQPHLLFQLEALAGRMGRAHAAARRSRGAFARDSAPALSDFDEVIRPECVGNRSLLFSRAASARLARGRRDRVSRRRDAARVHRRDQHDRALLARARLGDRQEARALLTSRSVGGDPSPRASYQRWARPNVSAFMTARRLRLTGLSWNPASPRWSAQLSLPVCPGLRWSFSSIHWIAGHGKRTSKLASSGSGAARSSMQPREWRGPLAADSGKPAARC